MHARDRVDGVARIHDVAPATAMDVQVDEAGQDVIVAVLGRIDRYPIDIDDTPFKVQLPLDPAFLGQDVAGNSFAKTHLRSSATKS